MKPRSFHLEISLFRRHLRGEKQKDLALELGVSNSRIHQRIRRAEELTQQDSRPWDATPELIYWETEAAQEVTFTSEYINWPGRDGDYLRHRHGV